MAGWSKSEPNFWLNVTTSFNWERSPVGIVRVEQEIMKQLRKKLPDRFNTVVFQNGEFYLESSIRAGATGHADFWPEPSFGASSDPFDPLQPPSFRATGKERPSPGSPNFRYGDVLITIGLDWDYPGLHDAIRKLKNDHGLTVVTCCYDLIPILFPQYCVGDVASWFKNYIIDMTWSSDGILCISDHTQRDYQELADGIGLPARRTEVIRLGSSLPTRNENEKPAPEVAELIGSRFFLFVSTIERRKNHEVLYRAYHLIRRQFRDLELPTLVFVGMEGWGVEGLMSDIRLDPQVKDNIVVLPHVTDSELSLLYENCEAFLFPSLYEGWGLPVAEALQFGRPVLASNAGSIPEVGGDMVRYVDPWSARDWAAELLAIIRGETDVAEWSERIGRDFKPYDWAAAADTLIALAQDLRAARPDEFLIEPGYDVSSMNGIHYGGKIIYDFGEGIVCYGPYVGMPAGKHLIRIEYSWLSGKSGFLKFIAGHNSGKTQAAVQRVDMASLKPGSQVVELNIDLKEDVTDLEVVCEAHKTDRMKMSVDSIVVKLDASSGASNEGTAKGKAAVVKA